MNNLNNKQRTQRRMIRTTVSTDPGVAKLSQKAAVLYFMLIPHFTSYGKTLANPHYIRGMVCPLISYIDAEEIPALIDEISTHTTFQYWEDDNGIGHLQWMDWWDHQDLRQDRLGIDRLPDHPSLYNSRSTPGVVRSEGECKAEEEIEEEIEPHPQTKDVGEGYVEGNHQGKCGKKTIDSKNATSPKGSFKVEPEQEIFNIEDRRRYLRGQAKQLANDQ